MMSDAVWGYVYILFEVRKSKCVHEELEDDVFVVNLDSGV